jgi:hypothetical protein
LRDSFAPSQFADAPPAEARELLWSPAGGPGPEWYRPDYARCLTQVLPTALRLIGWPTGRPDLLDLLPAGSPRRARRVLFLTVDSLGFREWAHTHTLQRLYPRCGTWVTSVFPSITSCALSSLYQGLAPARHGVLGHKVWQDWPGGVVDMLTMRVDGADAPLPAAGFDVQRWKREPGLLESEVTRGLPGYHLMPRPIVHSGLSTYSYGTVPRVGFAEPAEGMAKAAAMLRDLERGWVSVYLSTVDTLCHVLGGGHPSLGVAVRHIEDLLAQLAASLTAAVLDETLLVVVADHGQSLAGRQRPLYGEPMEWLKAHTRALGFSGRVMHVYLGRHPAQPVRDWLTRWLAGDGVVLDFEQAAPLVGLGHPGVEGGEPPVDPARVRASLGDLVVVLEDGLVLRKRPPEDPSPPYPSQLVSQHGALTWHEMLVPVLFAPLAEMLPDNPRCR